MMEIKHHRRKVNDDYGIFYNQTHDSPSSQRSEEHKCDQSEALENQVMSRVDWIIALRNMFHRLQSDGKIQIEHLIRHLKMANFDLVPTALYEASHESHEKGYSLTEILQAFQNEIETQLTLDQVIDVPFLQNKMAKVDVPVVPVVQNEDDSSECSMESVDDEQDGGGHYATALEKVVSATEQSSSSERDVMPSSMEKRHATVWTGQSQYYANHHNHQAGKAKAQPSVFKDDPPTVLAAYNTNCIPSKFTTQPHSLLSSLLAPISHYTTAVQPLSIFQLTQETIKTAEKPGRKVFDIFSVAQLSEEFQQPKSQCYLRSVNLPSLRYDLNILATFLPQILILNLQNCNLAPTTTIEQMTAVQFLNLSQNPKLDINFSKLPMLQELYLSRNALTEVPHSLLCHPNLELLDLTRNKIATFNCLRESKHLKVCAVSHNLPTVQWFESQNIDWESSTEELAKKYSQFYANSKTRALAFKTSMMLTPLASLLSSQTLTKDKSYSHMQKKTAQALKKEPLTAHHHHSKQMNNTMCGGLTQQSSRSRSMRTLDVNLHSTTGEGKIPTPLSTTLMNLQVSKIASKQSQRNTNSSKIYYIKTTEQSKLNPTPLQTVAKLRSFSLDTYKSEKSAGTKTITKLKSSSLLQQKDTRNTLKKKLKPAIGSTTPIAKANMLNQTTGMTRLQRINETDFKKHRECSRSEPRHVTANNQRMTRVNKVPQNHMAPKRLTSPTTPQAHNNLSATLKSSQTTKNLAAKCGIPFKKTSDFFLKKYSETSRFAALPQSSGKSQKPLQLKHSISSQERKGDNWHQLEDMMSDVIPCEAFTSSDAVQVEEQLPQTNKSTLSQGPVINAPYTPMKVKRISLTLAFLSQQK